MDWHLYNESATLQMLHSYFKCKQTPEWTKRAKSVGFSAVAYIDNIGPPILTLEALCIRKSASQCGNFAWNIAALADCHDVMLIDCAMKNASIDAKNTIGLHLKFSSWKACKVKNSQWCARFCEAWRVKNQQHPLFLVLFECDLDATWVWRKCGF